MPRVAYVNGRYVRHAEAVVHVEDRGYQFADGIYEVWGVLDGRLIDAPGHLDRLDRSLSELQIPAPVSRRVLVSIVRRLVTLNLVDCGLVYLQVTRGVARRDHAFPKPAPHPALVLTAKSISLATLEAKAQTGVAAITVPDNRWGRCDIKTVGLLPNVLAKEAAFQAGAAEAWFVDADGKVTEGSSTNAWILDRDGILRTRSTDDNILKGVTRTTLLEVIAAMGLKFEPRAFTVEEALEAREAFMTSATSWVTPIVTLDGRTIANGVPGETALKLRAAYLQAAKALSA